MNLQQRLASANEGEEIDITAENLISAENVSLTVNKAVTIKNGSAAGSSFEIKASGVVFDGVTGIRSITVAEGAGDFSVKNGDELTYLTITGGSNSESKICIVSTAVDEATVGRADAHIVLGEADAAEIPAPVAAVRSVGSRASSRTSASIKKITITEKCILESASESDTFTRISVASGVENVTLRGKANIEQLVVTSSESKILVGSSDVKIEQAAGEGLNDIQIESEPGKNIDVSEIKKFKPLDLSGSNWKIWTDSENYDGKAVINSFDADSITVSASKTPSRYPWDATVYFLHTLEEEAQYLVEFEAKFTGTPAETSFNVYDVTQKKNICVAPFSPTGEWRTYRFMASINSDGKADVLPYEGDEIEFSFRLTEGTLEVKNFTVYNCWEEDFYTNHKLKMWDTWFQTDCGESIMMYDITSDSAKAFRMVDKKDAYFEEWMTNVGYKLGALNAGGYCFAFHSETPNLKKLNIHILSDGNDTELGQAIFTNGTGDYYVNFTVPLELDGKELTMQFQLAVPAESKMETKWNYATSDTLSVSKIQFGPVGTVVPADGAAELDFSLVENSPYTKNWLYKSIPNLAVGSIYKVTFDVTSDVNLAEGKFAIWGHSLGSQWETTGNGHFALTANTPKPITMYMPVYGEDGEKTHSVTVELNAMNVDCNLTFGEINWEKTSIDMILSENSSLGLYYAGFVGAAEEWWGSIPAESVPVASGESLSDGALLLCDTSNWGSTENCITAFRHAISGESNVNVEWYVDKNNENKIKYTNDTGSDITLKFSLDENLDIVVTK